MADLKEQPTRKTHVPKAAIITVLTILLLPVLWYAVHTQTFRLATSRQPDRYTELYFADATKTPELIESGKVYKQSFVVVNHEAGPHAYSYQVTISGGGQLVSDRPVSITLRPGERAVRDFNVISKVDSGDLTITVNLLDKQQSIRFHAKAVKGTSS